jgi:glycerol-3-phosphate acyltransferase PlsY
MQPFAVVLVAYLLGSIPFGYLIVRAGKGADVRETGSGGTGATNVTRRAGKGAGVVTLLLDAGKGTAAGLLARWLLALEPLAGWWVAAAAILVVLGHIFPIWLRFRGGKGVATGLGVFLVLAPAAVMAALVVFLAMIWLTRFVSLASIAAALAIPLFLWLHQMFAGPIENFFEVIFAALMCALLIVSAHRGNIGRLLMGTEPRIGG